LHLPLFPEKTAGRGRSNMCRGKSGITALVARPTTPARHPLMSRFPNMNWAGAHPKTRSWESRSTFRPSRAPVIQERRKDKWLLEGAVLPMLTSVIVRNPSSFIPPPFFLPSWLKATNALRLFSLRDAKVFYRRVAL
jgi:hypothetical protein